MTCAIGHSTIFPKILSNFSTVSLNIYNILDHTPFEGFFNSPSYSLYSKNLSHSRLIELRFEMSFGKQFRLRVSPQ